ncbi:MAG: MFS transporter [Bacteroidota bacterium]
MPTSPPTERVYTRQFWLLCASGFLFFASFNLIIPALPDHLESMGGGQYIGLIIALFTVTAGASRPFSGKLTDQWGRLPVMIFGVAVCVLAGFLYPMAGTVLGFLAIRLLHGFSTGFKPTATSAFVGDIVPSHRRGEALGFLSTFGSMGMGIGPYFGPLIADAWGTTAMFITSSVLAALSVIILLGMKETLPNPQRFHRHMLHIKRREIITPEAWPPAIVMVLTIFTFGVVLTLAPDFTLHLGFPEAQKGIFFTLFTFSSLLVRFISGKASDRWGRVIMLRIGMWVLIAGVALFATATSITQYVMGSVLIGFAVGNNQPSLFAWTIDRTPDHLRGRGLATVYILLEIGVGAGALVAGWIFANQVENLKAALLSPIPLVLIAFVYLVRTPRDVPAQGHGMEGEPNSK